MRTASMTEYNQHSSRVARVVEAEGEVVVMRRGKALFKITLVPQSRPDDPLETLIRAGLARPPRAKGRRTKPFPSVKTDIDIGAMLDEDRRRLDG